MSKNAEAALLQDGTSPKEDEEDEAPKMLTAAEAKELADRKLRGVLKERAKDQDELARFRDEAEKRKQENMSKDELLARERAEKEELLSRLKAFEESTAAELAEIDDENQSEIKALKKSHPDLAELIPDGLAPKALAKWLSKFKVRVSTETISVHGGGGRGPAPLTDEQRKKAHDDLLAEKGRAFIFGSKKGESK